MGRWVTAHHLTHHHSTEGTLCCTRSTREGQGEPEHFFHAMWLWSNNSDDDDKYMLLWSSYELTLSCASLLLHHYSCRLCRVREVMPVIITTVCITLMDQQTFIWRVRLDSLSIYTTECICSEYMTNIYSKCWIFPVNVSQTVDLIVWELALLFIKVQVWSVNFLYFFICGKNTPNTQIISNQMSPKNTKVLSGLTFH